jgi:3-dehydroquinate synthase
VTDVAGFAASTYMRGLPVGFVASTLLAQVDASVGGKNGVNVEGYKNMVGTFNQPDFVLCDTTLLATLPEREFRAGLAEIIKAGVIADPVLFGLFETHTFEDFRRDDELLTRAITAAIKVKAAIVERDEREAGERKLLNLGHTFGHAVEKSTQSFLHGEAVAIGMAMACELSVQQGVMAHEDAARIKNVTERMGLPLTSGVDAKRLMKVMKHDKKRDTRHINMVLPVSVGRCEIRRMPIAELENIY